MHMNTVTTSPVLPATRLVEQLASPGLGSFSPRSPLGEVSPAAPHSSPVIFQGSRATQGASFRGSVGGSAINLAQVPTVSPVTSSPRLCTSSPRLSISSIPPSAMVISTAKVLHTDPWQNSEPIQRLATDVNMEKKLSETTPLESVASLSSRLHSTMTTLHAIANELNRDVQKVSETTPVASGHGCNSLRSPVQSPSNRVFSQGPNELDVSGITSDEPSNLVTFDTGATDPPFFVKTETSVNTNTVVSAMPIQAREIYDSPPITSGEVSAIGSMHSLFRVIPGNVRSRSQSRSVSPAPSPIVVTATRTIQDVEERSAEVSQVTVSPTQSSPVTDNVTKSIPESPLRGQKRSESASTWATAGLTQRTPWVPAITSPTYFWRHDERRRGSGFGGIDTPPSSACSTPRRNRRRCFNDLYADAAERDRRRKERREAIESDTESQLQASRESSLRATRRYRSSDTRTVLERTEDHLRKKAEHQQIASLEKKMREEEELAECTFKPAISHPRRPSSRVPDERELERHLRQLAHKQLDVKARLVQLEYEWLRAHAQRRTLVAEKFKQVQQERKQDVYSLLSRKEGQTYYWDRVQRMSEMSSMSRKNAQSAVLCEIIEDHRKMIHKQVTEEVDNELQVHARDLEFWTRRNVLLETLEGIETRSSSSLEIVAHMPAAFAIIKASGFVEGLAKQLRDNPPVPVPEDGELGERMGSAGSMETVSTSRTRSQSPLGVAAGTTVVITTPRRMTGASEAELTSRHASMTSMSRVSHATIVTENPQWTTQPTTARVLSTTSTTRVVSTSAVRTPSYVAPPVASVASTPLTPSQVIVPQAKIIAHSQSIPPVARQISAGSDFVPVGKQSIPPVVRQISAGSDFMPAGQQVITRKSMGGDFSAVSPVEPVVIRMSTG